jgi:DNA-binding NtrC family response regulator
VHVFENLCDAVRAMMGEETHLLVLDLRQMALPCETALSLFREIDPRLPVILTVAEPGSPEVARWARAGVFRVIAKPLDARELLAAVEHAEALARPATSARDSAARPASKPSPA